MTDLERTEFVVRTIADTAIENEKYFGDLDSVVGDGDFGYSLARGFEKLLEGWDGLDRTDAGTFLKRSGMVIASRFDLTPTSSAQTITVPPMNSAPLTGALDASTFRNIAKAAPTMAAMVSHRSAAVPIAVIRASASVSGGGVTLPSSSSQMPTWSPAFTGWSTFATASCVAF